MFDCNYFRSSYLDKLWDMLKSSCPEFVLPDPNDPKPPAELSAASTDGTDGAKKDEAAPTAKEAGGKDAKKGSISFFPTPAKSF